MSPKKTAVRRRALGLRARLSWTLPGAIVCALSASTNVVAMAAPSIEGPLTVDAAIALALEHDPTLAATADELRALEAEARQADVRPNPEFEFEVEDFAGTGSLNGVEGLEATLLLSQRFERSGRRARRAALAGRARDLGDVERTLARLDVITSTRRHFAAVVAAREHVDLADELVAVAEQMLDAVRRRVRAGATSEVEERRARVELATSRIDRDRRVQELRAARTRLAAGWGSLDPHFTHVVAPPPSARPIPSADALVRAIETSPSLRRWNAEIARRRASRDLERARAAADVTVGAGVRAFNESGDVAALITLSLPLNVFDANDGSIAAAEARLTKASHERRRLHDAVGASLLERLAHARARDDEVRALTEEVIPEATAAFELARQSYARGRMPLTDVLEIERTLFELRARRVDAQRDLREALAELERLVGAPLSELPAVTEGR